MFVVIGATSVAQLRENLGAFQKQDSVTAEVLAEIAGVYKRYRDPSKI